MSSPGSKPPEGLEGYWPCKSRGLRCSQDLTDVAICLKSLSPTVACLIAVSCKVLLGGWKLQTRSKLCKWPSLVALCRAHFLIQYMIKHDFDGEMHVWHDRNMSGRKTRLLALKPACVWKQTSRAKENHVANNALSAMIPAALWTASQDKTKSKLSNCAFTPNSHQSWSKSPKQHPRFWLYHLVVIKPKQNTN